ncbi:MAG: iron ABC transporter permease [Propionibacterium sp.]|nr:iron ABC transporter permease [Propionibacterium sp.]
MSTNTRPETTTTDDLLERMRLFRLRRLAVIATVTILLVVCVCVSALQGVTDISLAQIMQRLLGWWPLGDREPATQQQWVAFSLIRAPRIVVGLLAGVALAAAGTMMQVITGNAMASPFTTGISNAAAFGASMAILSGWRLAGSQDLATIVLAFAFAGLCSILVFGIATLRGMGRHTIVLTGIAFSYLFSALGALMQFIADERELASIVSWTFGDLGSANWKQIGILAIVVAVGTTMGVIQSGSYTLLSSGEEGAIAMGVDVLKLRRVTSVMVTLLAATAVSFTGVIGFVGLVAPHLARLLVGHDYRFTFPLSLLTGALLVVGADLLGRTIVSPSIIPVGIVVSVVGVPVFIWLILRRGGS